MNDEKNITANIIKKLSAHKTVDLQKGINAEKYYTPKNFREDISQLSLKSLEDLKCNEQFRFDENKDHQSILNDKVEVLSARTQRVNNKLAIVIAGFAILIAIGSFIVSIISLTK